MRGTGNAVETHAGALETLGLAHLIREVPICLAVEPVALLLVLALFGR